MNGPNIPTDYKEDLTSNSHQEILNKIGKRDTNASCKKNFFEKNGLFFENFFKEIADENKEYIVNFPLFLKSTKYIPIDFFIEKSIQSIGFMSNLIKYAIMTDEEHLPISEAALISISKLLKSNSVQILDLILKIKVELNGEETTFSYQLPEMVKESKTDDQKRSLLRCISVMSSVLSQIEEFFIDFFLEQLQINDPDRRPLKKTAASSASQIICNNTDSNFSDQIIGALPLDIQDPEISKYCFKSLIARCNNGNCYCFDIQQMIDFACSCQNRISFDAVQLLITASLNSPKIFEFLLQRITFDNLLQDTENPKSVCLLISSIISKEKSLANSFIPLIENLVNQYYESKFNDKVFIIQALCSIILNSDVDLIKDRDSVYEVLLEGIYIDNDDINAIVSTLRYLNYEGEDFHQALFDLTQNSDVLISFNASKILSQIDEA